MTDTLRENYAIAVHNLWHNNKLKDELYTEAPSELRAKSLKSIYNRIKAFEDLVAAYELVSEDLCIVLTEPANEPNDYAIPP